MDQLSRELARVREQTETLAATRGDKKKPLSAIRRGELLALAARPMLSRQVTAAPTMEEHNALQDDVKAIFDALKTISNVLGTAALL